MSGLSNAHIRVMVMGHGLLYEVYADLIGFSPENPNSHRPR